MGMQVVYHKRSPLSAELEERFRAVRLPLDELPRDARHVIRLDRGDAGSVARVLPDEAGALWAFRGLVSTFERPENRVGPDAQLRSIALLGPGGREVSIVQF